MADSLRTRLTDAILAVTDGWDEPLDDNRDVARIVDAVLATGVTDPIEGAWVAFYSDWSGFAVFSNELDALRYAVDHTMNVGFRPWGDIR